MCTLGTGAPNTPPDHQTPEMWLQRERERARLDERQEDDVEGRLEGDQGCEGHSQRLGGGGSADMDGFSASATCRSRRGQSHRKAGMSGVIKWPFSPKAAEPSCQGDRAEIQV